MSRFNKQSTGTKTTNLAGGQAYSQSPELELLSILLTSFANESFYRSAGETFDRLKYLIGVANKQFVAKAAIYARTQFGMRSITHVVASELAKHISGVEWAKRFYNTIVYRPDDITEILSYHTANNGKIPNSMKKGLAAAFDKFDAYKLGKYRGEGKGFKLIDAVNLVHPVPVEKNAEALQALVKGELKSFDTWETELSKAGQEAESEDQKAEFKKEVWISLISEKKIGYFALLLRNLRNIIEQAPEVVNKAIEMLLDESLIKRSLVLPFRFLTASDEIRKVSGEVSRKVLVGIAKAIEISLNNVPLFEGPTLIVLDVSSSMRTNKVVDIGALFTAALAKTNNADVITFDGSARYVQYNPLDSVVSIAGMFRFDGGSTNFHSIFEAANRKYNRIIILSDMQGWVGHDAPTGHLERWKQTYDCNPFVYSFDLKNYGSMQFPEQNVFAIAGFSEKIFSIMGLMEKDKKALFDEINKTDL